MQKDQSATNAGPVRATASPPRSAAAESNGADPRTRLRQLMKRRRAVWGQIGELSARIADLEARARGELEDGSDMRALEAAQALASLANARAERRIRLDRLMQEISEVQAALDGACGSCAPGPTTAAARELPGRPITAGDVLERLARDGGGLQRVSRPPSSAAGSTALIT